MTPEREPVDDAALIAEIIAQAEKEYEADTFPNPGRCGERSWTHRLQ